MKTLRFINSKNVKDKKEKINREDINIFIETANNKLNKGDFPLTIEANSKGIPHLNVAEFAFVVKEAKKQGWKLTVFEDYQTYFYKFERL